MRSNRQGLVSDPGPRFLTPAYMLVVKGTRSWKVIEVGRLSWMRSSLHDQRERNRLRSSVYNMPATWDLARIEHLLAAYTFRAVSVR